MHGLVLVHGAAMASFRQPIVVGSCGSAGRRLPSFLLGGVYAFRRGSTHDVRAAASDCELPSGLFSGLCGDSGGCAPWLCGRQGV